MYVPFLDVGAAYRELKSELDLAYHRVMDSGQYILGREVEAFEAEFAAFCGVKHCIGTGNGLDALTLALRAYGIGPGDEVIVPANTYIATWLAVSAVGAKLVPVEPNAKTCNIDPARVKAAITPRTKALMPVHLYGAPADMSEIAYLAHNHELRIISDGAQAHGAQFCSENIGRLGSAVCFSFYPGKNLGALGDGGCVTTNDGRLAMRLARLRHYGSEAKYHNIERGGNSRLDELQASFLRVKLKYLEAWNTRRDAVAWRYLKSLGGCIDLPQSTTGQVWHLFVVRHARRDALQQALTARGVGTLIHYPVPPHLQPAYADLGFKRGAFPITEQIHDTCLSLPMGPHLTDAQVDYVCEQVIDACHELQPIAA